MPRLHVLISLRWHPGLAQTGEEVASNWAWTIGAPKYAVVGFVTETITRTH